MCKFLSSLIVILLYFISLNAARDQKKIVEEKHYTLSICAIFSNEAEYLKEWIEYHLLVGVDHFFLYNVGSTDNYLKRLSPYIEKGIVTLIKWHHWSEDCEENAYKWSLGVQIPAYENAMKYTAINKTKWLTFIDVQEFLVSPVTNIVELLEKYDNYPGVIIGCDCYDASRNQYMLPPRKLLIQTTELTKPLLQNPQKEVTKIIFKPDQCNGFSWPPYRCSFSALQVAKTLEKSELSINQYLNRKSISPFQKERIFTNHRLLSEEEVSQILSLDYEIEDQKKVIHRFIPELAQKMGYDLDWGW